MFSLNNKKYLKIGYPRLGKCLKYFLRSEKMRVTFFGFVYAEKSLFLVIIIFWEKAMSYLVSFLTFFKT